MADYFLPEALIPLTRSPTDEEQIATNSVHQWTSERSDVVFVLEKCDVQEGFYTL